MNPTIGQRLDLPGGLFGWLDHAMLSLATLRTVIETDMCGHLGSDALTLEELARRCALPVDRTRRFVYFLAAEEIVALTPDGAVLGTPRSRRLREMASLVMVQSRTGETGPHLTDACRNGTSAYERRYGEPVFAHLRKDPAMAAHFADYMSFLNRRVLEFVFAHHEFRPFELAVDVGGSHGGLLMGLLARRPDAHGVLFDLPETVAQSAASVRASPQGERIEMVGGDFFEQVPEGDLYLLKMILHDWDDAECRRILARVRASIRPHGRLAVIEFLLPEQPAATGVHIMDMAMMIWATGRERRLSEFATLFDAAGFRLDRVTDNPRGQSVIEAVPI